jgi:hypothetical protein
MPQSKHRRKPGGKAVKHPGKAAALRTEKRKQDMERIEVAMVGAARDLFADTDEDTRFMAEMVMWGMDERTLTTSKAALIAGYLKEKAEPPDDRPFILAPKMPGDPPRSLRDFGLSDDEIAAFAAEQELAEAAHTAAAATYVPPSPDDAEATFRRLIDHELITVNGDIVSVHPRLSDPRARR